MVFSERCGPRTSIRALAGELRPGCRCVHRCLRNTRAAFDPHHSHSRSGGYCLRTRPVCFGVDTRTGERKRRVRIVCAAGESCSARAPLDSARGPRVAQRFRAAARLGPPREALFQVREAQYRPSHGPTREQSPTLAGPAHATRGLFFAAHVLGHSPPTRARSHKRTAIFI